MLIRVSRIEVVILDFMAGAAGGRDDDGRELSAGNDPTGHRAGSDPREQLHAAAGRAGKRASDAREAASDRAAQARDAAGEAVASAKPRLRGVSHQWAFVVSLLLGTALIVAAGTPKATLAVSIYALSLSALLGTSALYHRVNWRRPRVRAWMRRLDHSMIFVLIAGTYTPFALLVLSGPFSSALLVVAWVGAAVGAVVEMIWIDHPKWVGAMVYLSLGWVGVAAVPGLWDGLGPAGTLLLGIGGALYTIGAIIYATQRPNPRPAVFGYHEVFHALVIAAAAAHFAAVAFFALPAAG